MIIYTTINQKPIVESSNKAPYFDIDEINIAVKNGIEVHINSSAVSDPNTDCWFAIHISYPDFMKKDRSIDNDTIITNGEVYFLCRRSLGTTRFVLNAESKRVIIESISKYVRNI